MTDESPIYWDYVVQFGRPIPSREQEEIRSLVSPHATSADWTHRSTFELTALADANREIVSLVRSATDAVRVSVELSTRSTELKWPDRLQVTARLPLFVRRG